MRKIKIWKRQNKRETSDSNFRSIIEELIEKDGGTVHVYRQDTEGGASMPGFFLQESSVKDWKGTDIEPYLRNQYGGGIFNVRIDREEKDGSERQAAMLKYQIDGEPKEARFEVTKRKDRERAEFTDIFKLSMDFAKEAKGGDNGNSALIQALLLQNTEIQKQNSTNMLEMQKHSDNMMMDMQKRNELLLMELRRDKETGGGMSEMIANMMQMEEFKSMLQPKVEQNETLEMIRAVTPVLGALLAGKGGQPQGQIQMAEALPPGQPDINLGAQQLKTQATPSAKASEAPHPDKIPNGTDIKRDEFEMVMLDPLIDQINADANPTEIAIMIKQIIDWSFWRVKSGIEPHPAILGLVTSLVEVSQGKGDLSSIEKAYLEFCRMIEMPAELVEPVKNELIKIYAPFFLNKNQSGGVENATSAT